MHKASKFNLLLKLRKNHTQKSWVDFTSEKLEALSQNVSPLDFPVLEILERNLIDNQ